MEVDRPLRQLLLLLDAIHNNRSPATIWLVYIYHIIMVDTESEGSKMYVVAGIRIRSFTTTDRHGAIAIKLDMIA